MPTESSRALMALIIRGLNNRLQQAHYRRSLGHTMGKHHRSDSPERSQARNAQLQQPAGE